MIIIINGRTYGEDQRKCDICGQIVESDCDYFKGYYCGDCLQEIKNKLDEFADAQAWWNDTEKETIYDVITGIMMEREDGQK